MTPAITPSTRTLGLWSAAFATIFAIAYDLGQIAEWLGWLGSAGGPESASTPLGIVVLLTPSLFLGTSFLLMVVCVHDAMPRERRVWTRAAMAFATIYATMISINYFVQLAWVGPRLAAGRVAGVEPFLFTPFDSFLYAVDILGYAFMCLAALFLAFAFTGPGLERRARWFLAANAVVIPCLLLQMYWHWLIWIASVWAVVFPAATWMVALWFQRAVPEGASVTARAAAPVPQRAGA